MFWILRSNPIFYSTNKTSIYDWLQTLLLLIFIIQLDTVINEDKTKFLYTLHIPITLMKYRLVARESYRYALRRSKVTLLFLCSVSPFFDLLEKTCPAVSYTCTWEEQKGKGKERRRERMYMCAKRRKRSLRGKRTHIFCYPGRCPRPVRLERTTQSPMSVDDISSIANTSKIFSLDYLENSKFNFGWTFEVSYALSSHDITFF